MFDPFFSIPVYNSEKQYQSILFGEIDLSTPITPALYTSSGNQGKKCVSFDCMFEKAIEESIRASYTEKSCISQESRVNTRRANTTNNSYKRIPWRSSLAPIDPMYRQNSSMDSSKGSRPSCSTPPPLKLKSSERETCKISHASERPRTMENRRERVKLEPLNVSQSWSSESKGSYLKKSKSNLAHSRSSPSLLSIASSSQKHSSSNVTASKISPSVKNSPSSIKSSSSRTSLSSSSDSTSSLRTSPSSKNSARACPSLRTSPSSRTPSSCRSPHAGEKQTSCLINDANDSSCKIEPRRVKMTLAEIRKIRSFLTEPPCTYSD